MYQEATCAYYGGNFMVLLSSRVFEVLARDNNNNTVLSSTVKVYL